jgi:hypothetical protein
MQDIPGGVLVLGVGLVVVYVALSIRAQNLVSTLRARTHIQIFGAWIVMIACWPFVWALVLGDARHDAIALPSLLWPIVIIAIDMVGMRHTTYESHTQSKKSLLNMDANAICSLTFALSSIVSAQENACCKRIFLFAVLFCVAFVLPSIHTSTSSSIPIAIEALQKGFLAYATGLLLAGVLIASNHKSVGKIADA